MDIITLATNVVPDRSATFTVTVIVAGIGIVLCTLLVLIGVFYAFGAIVSKTQAKSKKKEAKKMQDAMEADLSAASSAAAAPAPVSAPAPVVEEGISGEVVAAISAAVYSMEGSSAVIRSVTRKTSPITTRNPWAQAAVTDNTRPF